MTAAARAIDRTAATVGYRAAFFGIADRWRAATPFVADLSRRTRRDAVSGWVVAGQALAGGAVTAFKRALAAVGDIAAPSLARPRSTAAADPEADLVGGAGVIAGAAVQPVIEIGAVVATADLAGCAALRRAADSAVAAIPVAAISSVAAQAATAVLSCLTTVPAATAIRAIAAIDSAAAFPGGATAVGGFKTGLYARPTAANLAGRTGVTARSAVLRIRFEIGAGAAATRFASATAAAIKRAAAAVGRAAAFPGLARQWRAADATVADLAGGTGGVAGSAVRRIGEDVRARATTATFCAGAVDTCCTVRAAGGPTRPRSAVPAGVAATTAGGRVALQWLVDTGSLLTDLA